MKDECDKVWLRAHRMAMKLYGYDDLKESNPSVRSRKISESIRHCRIFAMAYEMGFKNGRRRRA
jgi:hypothetical protein